MSVYYHYTLSPMRWQRLITKLIFLLCYILFLDETSGSSLQQQLHDVKVELDSEREAKLSLENQHQVLTNDRQLLAK